MPTAGQQARSGGTRHTFAGPGLPTSHRRPLSSQVRLCRNSMLLLAPLYLLALSIAFVTRGKATKSGDSAAGTASSAGLTAAILSCAIAIVLFWGSMASHGGFSGRYQTFWLFMSPVLCVTSFFLSMVAFGKIDNADAKSRRELPGAMHHEDSGLVCTCPYCSTSLSMQAVECSVCKAQFGQSAAWSVQPNSKLRRAR